MDVPSPVTDTRRALRYGIPVGLLGAVSLNVVLFTAGGGFSPPTGNLVVTLISTVFFLLFYLLGPTVVFGAPVVLYLRFGLRSPAPLLAGTVVFWEIVGGHPRWVVLFVLLQGIPMAVLYGVVATVEWYVRDRRGTLPSGADP